MRRVLAEIEQAHEDEQRRRVGRASLSRGAQPSLGNGRPRSVGDTISGTFPSLGATRSGGSGILNGFRVVRLARQW